MRFRAESTDPAAVQADVLAVPIYKEDGEISGDLAALDAASGGVISQAIEWGEFNILEHYTALIDGGSIAADKILLVNGVRRGRGAWRARRIGSTATRRLQGRGVERMALWLRDGEDDDGFTSAAVGAMQGTYRPYAHYGRVRDTPAMLRSVEEVVLIGEACRRRRSSTGRPCSRRESSSVAAWPIAPPTTSTRSAWPRSHASWRPTAAASRSSASRRCGSWGWARCWASGRARPTSRG